MRFEQSLSGVLISPDIPIGYNHQAVNPEVVYQDNSFKQLCLNVGVSKDSMNQDPLHLGIDVNNTPEPEMTVSTHRDIDLSLDISGLDL